MKKIKKNHLLESTIDIISKLPKGKILDLGCGDGSYSKRLKDLGFDVTAGDVDTKRFRYQNEIELKHCDITKQIPFPEHHFDYVLLIEVVEHLRNPYDILPEIGRVIKSNGCLIMSTPNILNLKSRFRFFFEGSYDYFREPPLDQVKNPRSVIFNLHLVPYRYHELEYLLSATGYKISNIAASTLEGFGYGVFLPIMWFQALLREQRGLKKGGIDYRRINKILNTKELLFGRQLIITAKKT
jgi:SAM-dependent methyltransferase